MLTLDIFLKRLKLQWPLHNHPIVSIACSKVCKKPSELVSTFLLSISSGTMLADIPGHKFPNQQFTTSTTCMGVASCYSLPHRFRKSKTMNNANVWVHVYSIMTSTFQAHQNPNQCRFRKVKKQEQCKLMHPCSLEHELTYRSHHNTPINCHSCRAACLNLHLKMPGQEPLTNDTRVSTTWITGY